MATGPETTFYTGVHTVLKEVHGMAAEDIEKQHNEYVGGVWDVRYDGPKIELWVEYKFQPIPKRATTVWKPDLSGLQRDWGYRKWRYGHQMLVVVGVENGRKAAGIVLSDPAEWLSTYTRDELASRLVPRADIARMIFNRLHGASP